MSIEHPESILKTIKECDDMGHEEFLKTYGFRKSTKYWLKYKGKCYASKAIVAVAHKHEGRKRPKTSKEAKGGPKTITQLNDLEFTVLDKSKSPPEEQ